MRSGSLTEVDKLRLQERTSLFINAAGTAIQRANNTGDIGVSMMKLYKVLANSVWDWHWLAASRPAKNTILGIGDLRWIPHRYGSLGQVAPQLKYPRISLRHGYFATFTELYQSKLYTQFGFRGAKTVNGETHFLFSKKPIPLELVKKQALTTDEWIYWGQIIECYAGQTTETLNAMASCRNDTALFHSLWFQYVVWKRNAVVLMTRLRDQELGTIADVDELLSSASASISQLKLKDGYYEDREGHIALVRKASSYTEFAEVAPFLNEGAMWTAAMAESLAVLRDYMPALEALHELLVTLCSRIGIVMLKAEPTTLEQAIEKLTQLMPSLSERLQINVWNAMWLRKNSKQIGTEMLIVIDAVYATMGGIAKIEFDRVSEHYKYFLQDYPLPCGTFASGY